MFNRKSAIVVTAFAAAILLFPANSWSQMPEGVNAQVVAVHNFDIPGLDRVELLKFTIEPGASIEMTLPADELCTVTQGVFSVTNHDLGTTNVYAAGSRFSGGSKGQKVTVSNPGDVLAVQWVYDLYRKE